jgi:hypothetical protein
MLSPLSLTLLFFSTLPGTSSGQVNCGSNGFSINGAGEAGTIASALGSTYDTVCPGLSVTSRPSACANDIVPNDTSIPERNALRCVEETIESPNLSSHNYLLPATWSY